MIEEPISLDYATFAARVQGVRSAIAQACRSVGRSADSVTLLPVTKGVPLQYLEYCRRAGLLRVGENRVQEALRKKASCPDLQIELIGTLQNNKAAKAFQVACRIQTLCNLEQAQAWEKAACRVPVLIQVNIDQDPAKQGVLPGQAEPLLEYLTAVRYVQPQGLMAILRRSHTACTALESYTAVARLASKWTEHFGIPLRSLSMGMSEDYPIAVAAGSTLVRVGRALFGPEPEVLV